MRVFPKTLTCSPRGVVVVAGGILVHLALGSIFSFGNMLPYVISYIRNRTDDSTIRNVDGMWMSSASAVSSFAGMIVGGLVDKPFGPRIATGIGALIFSLAHAVTYFAVKKSFIMILLTYGVLAQFGNTMAYGPPVQTVIKWFPAHVSFSAGFIIAGFGAGALIFNPVITKYINPDNLAPDFISDEGDRYFTQPDLLDRVPTCFLILAGIFIGMQAIGVCMISLPNADAQVKTMDELTIEVVKADETVRDLSKTDHKDSTTVPNGNIISKRIKATKAVELTTKQAILKMVKCRSFYVMWFSTLCAALGLEFVLANYKAYGQNFISDDSFLAIVGSFSAVFNCIGRPLWGLFVDRFRYKITVLIIQGGFLVLITTFFTTEYTGKAGFFIWICLIFFLFAGIAAIIPSYQAKLFGASNMSINLGFIGIAFSIAGILSGVIGTSLKAKIGWRGLFFFSGGMNVIHAGLGENESMTRIKEHPWYSEKRTNKSSSNNAVSITTVRQMIRAKGL